LQRNFGLFRSLLIHPYGKFQILLVVSELAAFFTVAIIPLLPVRPDPFAQWPAQVILQWLGYYDSDRKLHIFIMEQTMFSGSTKLKPSPMRGISIMVMPME